jgi:hypothetical protein
VSASRRTHVVAANSPWLRDLRWHHHGCLYPDKARSAPRESTQASDTKAEGPLQHAAKSSAERMQLGRQYKGLILEKTTPVATGDSLSSLQANASWLATSFQTHPQNDTQGSVPRLPRQAGAGEGELSAQRHQACSTHQEPTPTNIMDCSGPNLEERYSCFSDSLLPLFGTRFTSKEIDWAGGPQLENTSFSLAEWLGETGFVNDSQWTLF